MYKKYRHFYEKLFENTPEPRFMYYAQQYLSLMSGYTKKVDKINEDIIGAVAGDLKEYAQTNSA
ncbi:MAG: hypothetical protein ISS47_10275 [Candidatus Omnitrophica bacterium]|nr:hypothetical protein [Candidatus Omnitrophota bacterium]